MQMESLKLFCGVVRLRSFSKCAVENDVTQSTVSQTVQSLEQRLGVTLIDRSYRPWKLTKEGKTFYDGCRDLLERYQQLENRVKGLHEDAGSLVRVAAIYSVGMRHMSFYVQEFTKRFPQWQVRLEYLHPHRVTASVLNDEIDLGILSFPRKRRDLVVLPWKMEPMVLAVPPDHRLAKMKEVDASQLDGEKFVAFDRDLAMRAEVDGYLKGFGVTVDVALEFDNIESIKQSVEIGSGVSLLPRSTLDREVLAQTLAAVPLKGRKFHRMLGIIHRRGKMFNPSVTGFIEFLQREKEIDVPLQLKNQSVKNP